MPALLDLYCGVGGASMGYHRAGFDTIVGVDKNPQPNYPFDFYLFDLVDDLPFEEIAQDFDLIHASPPCQQFTVYGNNYKRVNRDNHVNLIPHTRALLEWAGVPYVIENVPRAPLNDPIQLCGTSFGIEVRRHRLFELGLWGPVSPPPCDHGRFTERKYPGSSNRPNGRTVCNIGEWRVPLDVQKKVMEMDWVEKMPEISQAIPPRYTKWIGERFLEGISYG